MNKAVEDGVEEILFFAREGYLLIEQYYYMCGLLKEVQLPETVYLEISRRAVMNASIENREDIYAMALAPYAGNIKEFLWDKFRVDIADAELTSMMATDVQRDEKALKYN